MDWDGEATGEVEPVAFTHQHFVPSEELEGVRIHVKLHESTANILISAEKDGVAVESQQLLKIVSPITAKLASNSWFTDRIRFLASLHGERESFTDWISTQETDGVQPNRETLQEAEADEPAKDAGRPVYKIVKARSKPSSYSLSDRDQY